MPNYEDLGSILHNHNDSTPTDRSEFQGEAGPQHLTPNGTPRRLSVGERALLLRREGMQPGSPYVTRAGDYNDATNPNPGSVQLTQGFRRN